MDRRSIARVALLSATASLLASGCGLLPSNRRVPPEPTYSQLSGAGEPREVGFGSAPHPAIAPPSTNVRPPTSAYPTDGSASAPALGGGLDLAAPGAAVSEPAGLSEPR